MPGPGRKPSTEATLRMPPLRRARLSAKRSERSVATRTLRSTMASCCVRSSFVAGPSSPKPALLTRISGSRPASCSVRARRSPASGKGRSSAIARGRSWPAAAILSATSASCASRRATSTTLCPRLAKSAASAAPRPAEAPVTRTMGFRSAMESRGRSPPLRHRELRDHLLRDGLRFYLFRIVGVARSPDAGVEAFDAELVVERQPVLDVEARAAELDDFGFDHHVVAKLGRLEEACPGVDHRVAVELVVPRELVLGHAERLREQGRGAAVEHREIAWKEHNTGRIAVAPFDAGVPGVDHHPHGLAPNAQRGAMRSAPSSRITSPLR